MQKTQLEKGLKRFTQKFQVEDQAARKAILTFKSRKEDQRHKKHPPPKKQWTFDSTYLENIEPQKCPFLLGRKRATPQDVTSAMMHCLFELSRHPLQG
jgi:hypothetical protein